MNNEKDIKSGVISITPSIPNNTGVDKVTHIDLKSGEVGIGVPNDTEDHYINEKQFNEVLSHFTSKTNEIDMTRESLIASINTFFDNVNTNSDDDTTEINIVLDELKTTIETEINKISEGNSSYMKEITDDIDQFIAKVSDGTNYKIDKELVNGKSLEEYFNELKIQLMEYITSENEDTRATLISKLDTLKSLTIGSITSVADDMTTMTDNFMDEKTNTTLAHLKVELLGNINDIMVVDETGKNKADERLDFYTNDPHLFETINEILDDNGDNIIKEKNDMMETLTGIVDKFETRYDGFVDKELDAIKGKYMTDHMLTAPFNDINEIDEQLRETVLTTSMNVISDMLEAKHQGIKDSKLSANSVRYMRLEKFGIFMLSHLTLKETFQDSGKPIHESYYKFIKSINYAVVGFYKMLAYNYFSYMMTEVDKFHSGISQMMYFNKAILTDENEIIDQYNDKNSIFQTNISGIDAKLDDIISDVDSISNDGSVLTLTEEIEDELTLVNNIQNEMNTILDTAETTVDDDSALDARVGRIFDILGNTTDIRSKLRIQLNHKADELNTNLTALATKTNKIVQDWNDDINYTEVPAYSDNNVNTVAEDLTYFVNKYSDVYETLEEVQINFFMGHKLNIGSPIPMLQTDRFRTLITTPTITVSTSELYEEVFDYVSGKDILDCDYGMMDPGSINVKLTRNIGPVTLGHCETSLYLEDIQYWYTVSVFIIGKNFDTGGGLDIRDHTPLPNSDKVNVKNLGINDVKPGLFGYARDFDIDSDEALHIKFHTRYGHDDFFGLGYLVANYINDINSDHFMYDRFKARMTGLLSSAYRGKNTKITPFSVSYDLTVSSYLQQLPGDCGYYVNKLEFDRGELNESDNQSLSCIVLNDKIYSMDPEIDSYGGDYDLNTLCELTKFMNGKITTELIYSYLLVGDYLKYNMNIVAFDETLDDSNHGYIGSTNQYLMHYVNDTSTAIGISEHNYSYSDASRIRHYTDAVVYMDVFDKTIRIQNGVVSFDNVSNNPVEIYGATAANDRPGITTDAGMSVFPKMAISYGEHWGDRSECIENILMTMFYYTMVEYHGKQLESTSYTDY